MQNNILVYSEKQHNRLLYVFDFLQHNFIDGAFNFTSNREMFAQFSGAKINYSPNPINGFYDGFSKLLLESTIKNKLEFSVLEQDKLGLIFYLLSRYEEYLPHQKDQHGRYLASNCYLYQKGLLQQPLVDILAIDWCNQLKKAYPQIKIKARKFKFINTIDVDNAWKYKNKGMKRTLGGLINDCITADFKNLKQRALVLSKQTKDPFDTFDWMDEQQQKYHNKSIYFWLLGNRSLYDKNIHHNNTKLQDLIKKTNQNNGIGIHPSYQSNSNQKLLKTEVSRLEKMTHTTIYQSRQHYIKLDLPSTYQNLINESITEDYSMGFADNVGFRAGTCTPFFWYDLAQEKSTPLKVFPFQIMDVTLRQYLRLNPEESICKARQIIQEIKAVNGTFISVFHNETFTNQKPWQGWQSVYLQMLKEIYGH